MKTDYMYAKEKLWNAVHDLATGGGDVRSRIRIASNNFIALNTMNFPMDLQNNWEYIYKSITKYGSIDDTMRRIKNSTGIEIAEKIFLLSYELQSQQD